MPFTHLSFDLENQNETERRKHGNMKWTLFSRSGNFNSNRTSFRGFRGFLNNPPRGEIRAATRLHFSWHVDFRYAPTPQERKVSREACAAIGQYLGRGHTRAKEAS